MITRSSYVVQGYKCPFYCKPACAEKAQRLGVDRLGGDDHGNHGNEWFYQLRKPGEGGMLFMLYTPEKPEQVPEDRWDDFRSGRRDDGFIDVQLVYHCPWLLDREGVLTDRVIPGCNLAEPCRTTREVGRVSREALFALLDRTSFVQPEAFWMKFEAIFEDQIVCANVERQECGDLAIQKCDKCSGHGKVPK